MGAAAASLEVAEVEVFYGALQVLDRISLAVAGGEFIALLGSSGCGKTTLLRALCGFVPVARGRITVAGRDITDLAPDKRDMAMVFQSYALWPHMTVAQNIGYGLKLRHVGRAEIAARIDELLAMLRLDGLGERWQSARRCCCSTSPCPTWMPVSARMYDTRSRHCSKSSASRPCMSRTIVRRRWSWPTALSSSMPGASPRSARRRRSTIGRPRRLWPALWARQISRRGGCAATAPVSRSNTRH